MIWKPPAPRPEEIEDLQRSRRERDALFLGHGLDRRSITGFVVDAAEPLGERVLDLGTGKGLAAVEMARRGARVATVDVSAEELRAAFLLAVAAGVDDLIEFHLADAGALPFGDGSFTLATMVNALHHLARPDAALAEISRVLAPGGRLVVADFTERGFELLGRIHSRDGADHFRNRDGTIDALAGRLEEFGLRCLGRERRFHEQVMVAGKRQPRCGGMSTTG